MVAINALGVDALGVDAAFKQAASRECRQLLWRDHADHSSPVLLWLGFNLANGAERFDDHLHHLLAFLDVGHLATTEQHADLDFVFVLEEFLGLTNLGTNVLFASLGAKTNFFRLGVRLPGVLFLVLVVLVFAVIHDSANRRTLVRGNFDEIQSGVASTLKGVVGGDDPQLLAFLADYPNGRNADVVVDAYCIAGFLLKVSACQCH